MQFKFLERFSGLGMLFLRIGLGLTYMFVHGYGKITGGTETWQGLGSRMSNLGIEFMHTFWGFMAAFAEFFGGLFLLLGLFYRPALVLLAITMIVATIYHIESGDPLTTTSHSMKMAIVFIGMLFLSPGRYSIDHLFLSK